MTILEILLLSIGLSMDAFAVAICKGTAINGKAFKKALIIGIWFGFFQAMMPFLGYMFGKSFSSLVVKIDHWIAFLLLIFLGINMAYQSYFSSEEHNEDDSVDFWEMFMLAVATSIDALAVGVTFSFFNVNIFLAVSIIGIISFIFSSLGVYIGKIFENKFRRKSELAGGIILICIAFRILIEHLK